MDNKAKYDPVKQWQWALEDEIIFTGRELDVINKALTQYITSNIYDVATILKLAEAFAVVQAKLAEYVDKGVIKEFVPSA